MLIMKFQINSFNLEVKKSLTKLVSSAIYSNLDKKRHEGINYKGKLFKECGFSAYHNMSSKEIIIKFHSLHDVDITALIKACLGKTFKIGDIFYSDTSVEVIEDTIDYENEVIVGECTSLVYKTIDTKRKFIFSDNPDFFEIIKRNILQKYVAINGNEYKGQLSIKVLKTISDKKCLYYGKYPYFGKKEIYMMKAEKEMLDLIVKSGFGSGNMKGFGLLSLVDVR